MADKLFVPTQEEVLYLARWARVAFAARCARRALPLFECRWPDAGREYVEAVGAAVGAAERAAQTGVPCSDDYAEGAREAAHAAACYKDTRNRQAAPPARAARFAAYAASTADPYTAAGHVVSAAANAVAAVGLAADTTERDFQLIRRLDRAEQWTDATPVGPGVFDPANDAGADFGPSLLYPVPIDSEVVVALRAVALVGGSADAVATHVVEVFGALNDYTLARYGVRLAKDNFRRLVYEYSAVRILHDRSR